LSEEENKLIFGKCNNPNYHGHNYTLLVRVTGEIEERTGYVIDTKELKDIINKHVIEKVDHKNLNLDVKEFADLNPTTENVACVIYDWLRPELKKEHDLKITLYETERNFVEYPS